MKVNLVFLSAPKPYIYHPSVILHENKGFEKGLGREKTSNDVHNLF